MSRNLVSASGALALEGRALTGRRVAAHVLRRASLLLARVADVMAGPQVVDSIAEPVLEFYAEAGAPEGALYLDGALLGMLAGVNRL